MDSTIYEDEKYFVDLLFQNNYKNGIIFVPQFDATKITLNVYSKDAEFTAKLTPVETNDIRSIKWKYERFDINNNKIAEEILLSKYDSIDNY